MNPTFARAEELFHDVLPLPERERSTFLDGACGADAALRAEVEALLAGHAETGAGFLEPVEPDLIGARIGGFVVRRLLGQGGMGRVFEAEQARPARHVALKVVRSSRRVRDARHRLELEAELMARLRHPGVAQIYEVGSHENDSGDWTWFAMELVPDAQSLLEHVRGRSVDVDGRLALFLEVCAAVQHGHQRGVIHRDLKPANLLVDGAGRVKVIDFGIARAMEDDETVDRATLVGTVAYMSPERCAGEAREVDARSDVYSLGVILFELLVGRPPHDLAGLPITQALKVVQESPPPRPSSLRRGIPADLETIVLACLAKDPHERYPTVEALGQDIERFRTARPIAARPPTVARQVGLFARRHRALAAATLAIALVLVTATVVSVSFAVLTAQAREAEGEAREHAEVVAGFLQHLLTAARPTRHPDRNVTARELLADAADEAERELAGRPEVLAEVLGTLGFSYAIIGDFEDAERVLARAAELTPPGHVRRPVLDSQRGYVALHRGDVQAGAALLEDALPGIASGPFAGTLSHVEALHRLGYARSRAGNVAEARAAYEESLALAGEGSINSVLALGALGDLAYNAKDLDAAERDYRRALEVPLHEDHPLRLGPRVGLANVLYERGDTAAAEDLWRAALGTYERRMPDHPDHAALLGNLALAHGNRGEWSEAEDLFERTLGVRRAAYGDADPRVAHTLSEYGWMLGMSGQAVRAESRLKEAVAVHRAYLDRNELAPDAGLAVVLDNLALFYRGARSYEPARTALEEALAIRRTRLPAGHPGIASTLTLLGAVVLESGAPAAAEPLLREAREIRNEKLQGHWLAANTESLYGLCLARIGRAEEGAPLAADNADALLAALGPTHSIAREALGRAVEVLEAAGLPERAAEYAARLEDR